MDLRDWFLLGLVGLQIVMAWFLARLWWIVKGPNGGSTRMATHHDIRNALQICAFLKDKLNQIEKRLAIPESQFKIATGDE